MSHTPAGGMGSLQTLRRTRPEPLPLGEAWTSHRWLASTLVVLVTAIPAAIALVVTGVVAERWTRSPGLAGALIAWSILAAVAYAVIRVVHRATRRLLPLATLLQMGLAFPGAAPSRFRLALHGGNTRRLRRIIDGGGADDVLLGDTGAAALMLELVADLSDHDRATRGHSERVRAYTELLATELGVSEDDRQRLRWAGLLHDIGKLEVPAEILNKSDRLTDAEFDLIRRHPLDGLRLAMPLWAWLGEFVLAVSDHHERWEGGGYPSGVAGTDISFAGRIVAVADAFDVMTSSRSYKAPVSAELARAELVRCSGTQFDPDVVRAFLAIDLDDLRRIVGVMALFAPLPAVLRRAAALSMPVRSAAGAAGVATAVATWTLAVPVGPVGLDHAAGRDRAEAIVAPTSDPGLADHLGNTGRGDERGALVEPRGSREASGPPRHDLPRTGTADAPPGTDLAPDIGPGPPGGAPAPPPRRAEPVGVIVDPEDGSVAVDGVHPDGPIDLIGIGPAGEVVCGGLGVCDPIEVDLPLTLGESTA